MNERTREALEAAERRLSRHWMGRRIVLVVATLVLMTLGVLCIREAQRISALAERSTRLVNEAVRHLAQ